MFVCLCHAVTDKKIKNLVMSGADSIQAIQAKCKAGGNCGMCVFQLRQLIEESKGDETIKSDFKKVGNE